MLIRLKTIWPALMLAASRNDRVSGRTRILVDSISTRNGFSHVGAPSGSKCAVEAFGACEKLDIRSLIHSGRPSRRVNTR